MRILRRPQLIELDKLEPGTCFLFGSWGETDLGIVVQINPNQRGFIVPKPTDPNLNGIPVVLNNYDYLDEFVMALPDATIRLPSDMANIKPLTSIRNTHPGSLVSTQDGLIIQGIYRHSNVLFFDITTGHLRNRRSEGFVHETWDVVDPLPDGGHQLIKTFGSTSLKD